MTHSPAATPEWDRRPFTIEEMRTLLAYLHDAPPHPTLGTRTPWYTPRLRRLIYWTAARTGFRRGELLSLQRQQFHLDATPAYIDIAAADAKNRQAAGVPIPPDLAAALDDHVRHMAPAAQVFRLPSKRLTLDLLDADLQGAGLGHLLDVGDKQQVDFHAFRATAIVWWLTVDRRDQLEVQRLARFKTLAMMQKYSRGFQMDRAAWVQSSPAMDQAAPRPTIQIA
jgi:integrase